MLASRSGPTLYESVLGERFAELPPALRRFHGRREGGRARGKVRVSRGRGLFARLIAWFIGAPSAGEAVPVELRIEVEGEREVWTRTFAGHTMVTRQWRAGAQLVEAFGLSQVRFELESSPAGIMFEQRRVELLRVPLPAALAPRVSAQAGVAEGEAWELRVNISFPLIGTVVEYASTMIVED